MAISMVFLLPPRLLNRRVLRVAPLGPAAVVVTDRLYAHQLQGKSHYGRSAAGLAVGYAGLIQIDSGILEKFGQFLRTLETLGLLVDHLGPLLMNGAGDSAVAFGGAGLAAVFGF